MHDTVRSAARVLDILEYLARLPDGASLSECVAALDLPKSSTLMLLRTVLARGYVVRDASDRYRLNETFRLYGFGWGGHRFARLIALARPVMVMLSQAVGETVILGAAEDRCLITLDKVVSEQLIRYDADLSTKWPFYCTAMGRTILAYATEEARERMLEIVPRAKLTPHTVTDLDRLRAIIARVRQDGYAIVEDEYALGGCGIAAPIFHPEGTVFAVLDVGCVTTRYPTKRDPILRELLVATKTLSQGLASMADE
jgi:DNA-binding IclR family transcriptional regulator